MSNVDKKSCKQRISERIKASKIATKLQDFALSSPDDIDFESKQMSPHQVTAGFKLLAKVLPDLKQVEHTGDLGVQVTEIRRTVVTEPANG